MEMKIIVPIMILMAIFIASVDSSTAQPWILGGELPRQEQLREEVLRQLGELPRAQETISVDIEEVLRHEQLGELPSEIYCEDLHCEVPP